MRMRSLAVGLIPLMLIWGSACGGDPPPPPVQPDGPTVAEGEEPRAPVKIPRAPFLSLPDTAAETIAKNVLEGGDAGRKLAFALQRGPFGPTESVLAVYIEEVEGAPTIGAQVLLPGPKGGAAFPLPVDNSAPLVRASEVVWASSDHGWIAVILMRRTVEEAEVQQNQAFYWNGSGFERAFEQEERIKGLGSSFEIRRMLL